MNEQQIKAVKTAFTIVKSAHQINLALEPSKATQDRCNQIIERCDMLLAELESGEVSELQVELHINYIQMLSSGNIPTSSRFPSGGIVSPSHVDGGEHAIIKNK